MNYEKIIGVGNTATVYEWEDDKVLKLFNQGYPKDAVEKEFHNAKAINNMNFSKPKAYEIILYKERMGIIYDKVEGESLLDFIMKTGDVQRCAVYMATLHKSILRNRASNVTNYKKFLAANILNASPQNLKNRDEILQILDKLQDGDTLCHGDFHPGNILIVEGQPMVIDFMNICQGNFLYDIARTVFLIQYTPVSLNEPNRKELLELKKTLTDLYLIEMNITREMLQDYLSVIIAARLGECPNEHLIE